MNSGDSTTRELARPSQPVLRYSFAEPNYLTPWTPTMLDGYERARWDKRRQISLRYGNMAAGLLIHRWRRKFHFCCGPPFCLEVHFMSVSTEECQEWAHLNIGLGNLAELEGLTLITKTEVLNGRDSLEPCEKRWKRNTCDYDKVNLKQIQISTEGQETM